MSQAPRPDVGLPTSCFAPHAVAARAVDRPDDVAVTYVGGEREWSLTNAELDASARRFAGRMATLDVGRGTRVGTFLPNGAWAHQAFLGLGRLVATEVPLNPALTGALLRHALIEAEVEVLVASSDLLPRVFELESCPLLRTVVQVDGDPLRSDVVMLDVPLVAVPDAPTPEPTDPGQADGPVYRDIAAVMFTSGTTGPSKGVRVPWATVYQFWSWVPDDAVTPDDVVYGPMSMAHNSGRSCFNYTMARGARFVSRERFSATEFWSDVRSHGCTVAALVGPMTQLLHSAPPAADDAENPLRSIICGPLIAETEAFKQRFRVRFATSYGMTETGIVLSTGWDHGPTTGCGKPRPDYPWPDVRVVDEWDEPVAPGSVGELIVRTAEPWAMNAGYYGRAEATAHAWRNGWFHTGDAFRVDEDGWFHLVDRMNDTIRRRGENISSYEVESVAIGHPDVADCAAIGVPAIHGEHEVMLVVELRPGTDPITFDPAALAAWLVPRLPRYMAPRYIDGVAALPRNQTTQRVKKHELRARGVTSSTWDADVPTPGKPGPR